MPASARSAQAERAASEIAPEIEVFELHAGARLEISSEERGEDIVSIDERVEERFYTWQDALARTRPIERLESDGSRIGGLSPRGAFRHWRRQ